MIYLILSFCVAFVIAVILMPLFIFLAPKLNIVDNPDGRLKLQKQPIPYLGGLAVFIGFFSIYFLSSNLSTNFDKTLFFWASFFLLVLGLADDFSNLSPATKFMGQIVAVIFYIKSGLFLKEELFPIGLNLFLSLFYFLSVINAFNLIDIMDGLSSTTAIWAFAAYLFYSVAFGLHYVSLIVAGLIGALFAFWLFNKPPQAKIYLGDAGALFIGGVLASIPFMLSGAGPALRFDYFAYILILAIPLLELLWLIVIRLYKGISPYHGSPDHFAIYFQKNGWPKSKILIFVSFVSIVLFGLSYLYIFNYINLALFLLTSTLFFMCWVYIIIKKALSKALI